MPPTLTNPQLESAKSTTYGFPVQLRHGVKGSLYSPSLSDKSMLKITSSWHSALESSSDILRMRDLSDQSLLLGTRKQLDMKYRLGDMKASDTRNVGLGIKTKHAGLAGGLKGPKTTLKNNLLNLTIKNSPSLLLDRSKNESLIHHNTTQTPNHLLLGETSSSNEKSRATRLHSPSAKPVLTSTPLLGHPGLSLENKLLRSDLGSGLRGHDCGLSRSMAAPRTPHLNQGCLYSPDLTRTPGLNLKLSTTSTVMSPIAFGSSVLVPSVSLNVPKTPGEKVTKSHSPPRKPVEKLFKPEKVKKTWSTPKAEPRKKKKKMEEKIEADDDDYRNVIIEIPPPSYDFTEEIPEDKEVIEMPAFLPPSPTYMEDTSSSKMMLLDAISSSLICSPNFKDNKNPAHNFLKGIAQRVADYDPEFVLKTALYTRRELNIRTPANFLLALAANQKSCRVYIRKYFKDTIRLPSDWIEVAELYQAFYDKSINYGSLPAALRRSMVTKFPDFDKYQLAKYNKDKSKSKKPKKEKVAGKRDGNKRNPEKASIEVEDVNTDEEADEETADSFLKMFGTEEDHETEEELEQRSFTLKQLIRKLHITEPVEHVLCLIGKKYPETLEEFYQARLPGTWEEERAGKRMKLPVPITWETQLSLKGNKAATWEQLIDSKKLPYMAMLRNLRNMIKAGISPKHHTWVLKKLSDQGAVIYSKQFPFRFFSAYGILDQLEQDYEKNQAAIVEQATKQSEQPPPRIVSLKKAKKAATSEDGTFKWWILKKEKKSLGKIDEAPYDTRLLQRYRKALDNAVKTATVYNVQPIRGTTVIFCDISESMDLPCTAARGLGKPRTLKEVGLLLGLMCKYSCEDSELILYNNNTFITAQVKKGTILENMELLKNLDLESDSNAVSMQSDFPEIKLTEILRDRVQIENLIVLSKGQDKESIKGKALMDFVMKYRKIVSPDLLFVSVALAGKHNRVDNLHSHPNDVFVSGYSDQILRFIAEKGSGSQLTHVENIDIAYRLESILISNTEKGLSAKNPKMSKPLQPILTVPVPIWHTVRVFISSTFRDMHGERDLLTRFIFPELRARARLHFINVVEVDLRWGVTEEDMKKKQGVEICLREAGKCDLFIGLLGERQGWVPLTSDLPADPEFDWLKELEGASLTELEMTYAALNNPASALNKAFFYIRNNHFMKVIPDRFRCDFEAEHSVSQKRMEQLKTQVRSSGLCAKGRYPCSWGGSVDGKPFVSDLTGFGVQVLNDLWSAMMLKYAIKSPDMMTEDRASQSHKASVDAENAKFVGRKNLTKQCLSKMAEDKHGIMVLSGKPGSGKSALMSALYEEYLKSSRCEDRDSVQILVVGSGPGSTSITSILRQLCADLIQSFSPQSIIPQEYKNLVPKFCDLLKSAGKMCAGRLVVFIDGVDSMEETHQPYNMEWLPTPIPQNVQFVLTTLEGGRGHKALQKRGATEVSVAGLDLMDKAKVIRSTLAIYRKSLDESPFNNQMKLLSSKRDAINPLYLTLACEELRVFSLFEQIAAKVKSLPQTLPQLLDEILSRIEEDVGKDLVRIALCLLLFSRQGIEDYELHALLSLHKTGTKGDQCLEAIKGTTLEPEDYLPSAVLVRLQRALSVFLKTSTNKNDTLKLSHAGIRQAIRQRYLNKKPEETEQCLHTLLAGYYWKTADPEGDRSWQGKIGKAFSELTFHLTCGGHFEELETVLCDLQFIQQKCSHRLANQLLEDFTTDVPNKNLLKKQKACLDSLRVKEYQSFVSRQIHLLTQFPNLTIQQALNDLPDSQPSVDAAQIIANRSPGQPTGILEWTNRPSTIDHCTLTIADLSHPVLCVAISPCENYLACGDTDCNVKIYDINNGKELRSFHGHSNKLTDLCYVNPSRLLSSGKDGLLLLWDSQTGQRISVLKGHSRSVNSCSSNGSLVASAGWDCNIKIWSVKTGTEVCEFKDMKPVNCVSFHPEDDSVVTGGWDSTIKIWDIFNKKRKAVLRGHSSSVRDAAFSPSGRYIASAAMDGEVKLWSAINGTQLGDIQGHSLPINKLQFSPSGTELITVSDDQKIKIWSGHLGKLLHSLSDNSEPCCVSFSPDGATVAIGYASGVLCLYDVESGILRDEVQPVTVPVRSITYSDRDDQIIIGTEDGVILVLNGSNYEEVYRMEGHSKAVLCVISSKRSVISSSDDFTCCVYKHQSQYQLKTKKAKSVSPVATLLGHEGPVTSCSLNPEETKLATASRDMSVRIWDMIGLDLDLIDWEPIRILHACHGDWINDCKWSNTGDFLVTCSNDSTAKVWDINSGKEKTSLVGHTSTIHSVSYKYGCILTTSSDGTAKVWSHKGTEITTLQGHQGRVMASDLFIKVMQETVDKEPELNWGDLVEDEEKNKKIQEKPGSVKFQEVVVVTCSDDGNIRLWKPLQANEQGCLTGHSDRVLSLSCSKSGLLSTCSLDRSVKLWTSDVSESDAVGRHNAEVTCVVSSQKETILASGSRDGCLKLWKRDENTDKFVHHVAVQAHSKSLNAICFLNEDKIATGSDDGTIKFWKIVQKNSQLNLLRQPVELSVKSPISCLIYNLQGFLVSGEWNGEIKVWQLNTDGTLKKCNSSFGTFKPNQSNHSDWVNSLRFRPKSTPYMASVGSDRKLMLWNFSKTSKDPSMIYPECRVEAEDTSKDDTGVWMTDVDMYRSTCFVGYSDGSVSRWKVSSQSHQFPWAAQQKQTMKVHSAGVSAVLATSDWLFTASHDRSIKIWTHQLKQVGQFCCPSPLTCLRAVKEGKNPDIICGDKLGNIYFMTWKM